MNRAPGVRYSVPDPTHPDAPERAEIESALEVLGKHAKRLLKPRDFHAENALEILNNMFRVQSFEHEDEED